MDKQTEHPPLFRFQSIGEPKIIKKYQFLDTETTLILHPSSPKILEIMFGDITYKYMSCLEDPSHFIAIRLPFNSTVGYQLGYRAHLELSSDGEYLLLVDVSYPTAFKTPDKYHAKISSDFSKIYISSLREIKVMELKDRRVLWKLVANSRYRERFCALSVRDESHFSPDGSLLVLPFGISVVCLHAYTGDHLWSFSEDNLGPQYQGCKSTELNIKWTQGGEICLLECTFDDEKKVCIGIDQWGVTKLCLERYGDIIRDLSEPGPIQFEQTKEEVVHGDLDHHEPRLLHSLLTEDFGKSDTNKYLNIREESMTRIYYRNLITGEIDYRLVHPMAKLRKDRLEWIILKGKGVLSCFDTESRRELWRYEGEKITRWIFYTEWSIVALFHPSYYRVLDLITGEVYGQITVGGLRVCFNCQLPYITVEGLSRFTRVKIGDKKYRYPLIYSILPRWTPYYHSGFAYDFRKQVETLYLIGIREDNCLHRLPFEILAHIINWMF